MDDNVTIATTGEVIDWFGATADIELWIYSSQAWVTASGTPVNASSPTDPLTFNKPYRKAVCTVNGATHKLSIAEVVLSSTEDADVNSLVTLQAYFVDVSGATPKSFIPFSRFGGENAFTVPNVADTTWDELALNFAGGLASPLIRDVHIQGDLNVEGSVTAVEGFNGITNENVPTALSGKNISNSALIDSDIDNPTVGGGTFEAPELNSPVINDPTFGSLVSLSVGSLSASGTITGTHVGNGAGLTGITGATGGVANTGSTTVGADTDANGVGVVSLQTRNLDRLTIANDGKIDLAGGLVSYTYGALPAAGKPGRRAIVTDNIHGEWIDTGAIWIPFSGGVVNVMNGFGVVADGVTDDTAALQDAADAAPGMYLYFPSRADTTIYMCGGVTIPAGVRIICDPGVTLKLKPSSSDVLPLPLFDVRGIDVEFSKLTLDGNRSNQSGAAQVDNIDNGSGGRAWRSLVYADGRTYTVNNLKVLDCKMANGYGAGLACMGVSGLRFEHNEVTDLNYEAAYILNHAVGYVEDIFVNHNRISNIGFGGVGVTLEATGNAIAIAGCDHGEALHNHIRSVDRDGIKIELGATHFAVESNEIYESGMVADGYGTDYPGIGLVSNDPLEHVQVARNIIDDCAQGINLQVGEGGVYDVAIEDNQIDAVRGPTQGYGLAIVFNDVTYTADKVKFKGNKVYNFELYGLQVGGGDDMTIFDNEFIGDGSTSQRGMHFQLSRAMANLTIEKNLVKGCVNVGAQGINLFGKVADGLTYTNLQFLRNRIYSGASGNIGFRADLDNGAAASDDFILSGLFDGNYVDGKVQTTAPAMQYGRNRVTGLYSVDGASAILSVVSQPQMLGASKTADFFGATAAHSREDSAEKITVNGAVPGDIVHVAGPESLFGVAGSDIRARVSANNEVTVSRFNFTASALNNPGSVTLNVRVEKV